MTTGTRTTEHGPICQTCGKVPPKTPDISWSMWEKRAYCGVECRPFRSTQLKRDELLEELEVLVGTDTWLSIADRLGIKPRSLQRRLDRMSLHRWARAIQNELKYARQEAA